MLRIRHRKPAGRGSRERLGTEEEADDPEPSCPEGDASQTRWLLKHCGIRLKYRFQDMVALQRQTIALRKKQTNIDEDALGEGEDDWLPTYDGSAAQLAADDAQQHVGV